MNDNLEIPDTSEETIGTEDLPENSEETSNLPEKINFQYIIDEWVGKTSGDKGIIIYDLDRDEIAGEYNSDKIFETASLYKLFVVYEGYRRLDSGKWKADELAGTTGYTIKECLDLAIRESYSPCAESLWNMIGVDALDEIIEQEYGIVNSDVSELISTPEDIAKILKTFYYHKNINDGTLLTQMKDSFLNQPTTDYNWRQGLPSGFSEDVNVYNKVGWEYDPEEHRWSIYNDAAIVEFPSENRHFAVVIMTNLIPYQEIRKMGAMLEKAFYENA